MGVRLRLGIPAKLAFNHARNLEVIEVTNKYSSGYWAKRGYEWFADV